MTLLSNTCFSDTFTVTRASAGSWTKGRYVEGGTSTFEITGSVQPMGPKETELLPEAYRTKRAYRVYTATELKTVDVPNSVSADSISIDGSDYEVIDVSYWRQMMPHYKAIVVRRENVAT